MAGLDPLDGCSSLGDLPEAPARPAAPVRAPQPLPIWSHPMQPRQRRLSSPTRQPRNASLSFNGQGRASLDDHLETDHGGDADVGQADDAVRDAAGAVDDGANAVVAIAGHAGVVGAATKTATAPREQHKENSRYDAVRNRGA
jgi:hypothetical protein